MVKSIYVKYLYVNPKLFFIAFYPYFVSASLAVALCAISRILFCFATLCADFMVSSMMMMGWLSVPLITMGGLDIFEMLPSLWI
jgi:hypothetical protein